MMPLHCRRPSFVHLELRDQPVRLDPVFSDGVSELYIASRGCFNRLRTVLIWIVFFRWPHLFSEESSLRMSEEPCSITEFVAG